MRRNKESSTITLLPSGDSTQSSTTTTSSSSPDAQGKRDTTTFGSTSNPYRSAAERRMRSRSFGNLIDFFQKKRKETWERLPKIPPLDKVLGSRGRRRKGEPKAGRSTSENKLGNESLPKLPVAPQIVLLLIMPFLPVVLYSLFFVSLSLFMLYAVFLFAYCSFLVALVITEVAIRPPWYKPSTPENGLTKKQLPAYWQGIWHNPKYDLDLEYEDVEFRNALGYTLRGWFVPAASNSSALASNLDTSGIERLPRRRHDIGIVCVHGGGRDRRAFLRHLPLFHHEGYDVLLFDLSEHGISDGTGKGFTFGVREKEDVKAAVSWLREEKKVPRVVVFGTSVGGSSSIMAAAEDTSIDAVIAENPVACAEDFALWHIRKIVETYAPLVGASFIMKPFYFLIARTLLWRMGALFGYVRPYQLIHRISPRPILLLHGTCDDIVPYSHSEWLFAQAHEPKELWLAKEAWHCALYDQHPDIYRLKVHKFLDTHFHHRQLGATRSIVDITNDKTTPTIATALMNSPSTEWFEDEDEDDTDNDNEQKNSFAGDNAENENDNNKDKGEANGNLAENGEEQKHEKKKKERDEEDDGDRSSEAEEEEREKSKDDSSEMDAVTTTTTTTEPKPKQEKVVIID